MYAEVITAAADNTDRGGIGMLVVGVILLYLWCKK